MAAEVEGERSSRGKERADRGPIFVIGSARALQSFRRSLLVPSTGLARIRVVLDRARYRAPEIDRVEHRLNDLVSDCGCGAGTVTLFGAAVGFVVWVLVSQAGLDWSLGLKAVFVLYLSSAGGKLAWLIRNRVVLWRLLSRLETARER